MLKKEIIYSELLNRFVKDGEVKFKQLGLSKKFGFSLSTVNNAIRPLAGIGAIELGPRGFVLVDARKALLYWATTRRLERDIEYTTRDERGVVEIEKEVPSTAVFTCYSAYKFKYGDVPADYSEVYFYLPEDDMDEAKERFPERKGPANVFVLKLTRMLEVDEGMVMPPQLYVDLWNLRMWYAKDFLSALEERLGL